MIVEIPRNIKYGRTFKVRLNSFEMTKVSQSHNFVFSKKLGLQALEPCKLRYFHLRSIIGILKFIFKKRLHFHVNVSFSIPVTKKPDQTRMGKGKGKRVY
jgi:ribosomal protein L16/L10AE